jgi:Rrf2 family protein
MLTRAADYAARVMIHLASLPSGTRVQRTILAELTDVPDSFLSKVLQGLVRARLVASRPGVNGGFELVADPENVTLLEVVEAIDGQIALNVCTSDRCDRQPGCAAHLVWVEAQEAVVRVLKSASLAKLAKQSAQMAACQVGIIVPATSTGTLSPRPGEALGEPGQPVKDSQRFEMVSIRQQGPAES